MGIMGVVGNQRIRKWKVVSLSGGRRGRPVFSIGHLPDDNDDDDKYYNSACKFS